MRNVRDLRAPGFVGRVALRVPREPDRRMETNRQSVSSEEEAQQWRRVGGRGPFRVQQQPQTISFTLSFLSPVNRKSVLSEHAQLISVTPTPPWGPRYVRNPLRRWFLSVLTMWIVGIRGCVNECQMPSLVGFGCGRSQLYLPGFVCCLRCCCLPCRIAWNVNTWVEGLSPYFSCT